MPFITTHVLQVKEIWYRAYQQGNGVCVWPNSSLASGGPGEPREAALWEGFFSLSWQPYSERSAYKPGCLQRGHSFRGRGSGTYGTLKGSAQQLGRQGSGALHHQSLVTSEQGPALKEVVGLLFHIFQMPSPPLLLPHLLSRWSFKVTYWLFSFVFLLNSGEPLHGLSHHCNSRSVP